MSRPMTTHIWPTQLDLVLLSVSSSLDNFIVGVSLGLRESLLSARLNLTVSAANAVGACVSARAGAILGAAAPTAAGAMAAAIFLYLAYGEATGYWRREPSPLSALALEGVAWRLAIPMTLNNIAGGVAGGIAHLGPARMGLAAFVASFFLMFLGHKLGSLGAARIASRLDPRCLATLAFAFLAVSQLIGVWHDSQQAAWIIAPNKRPPLQKIALHALG